MTFALHKHDCPLFKIKFLFIFMFFKFVQLCDPIKKLFQVYVLYVVIVD